MLFRSHTAVNVDDGNLCTNDYCSIGVIHHDRIISCKCPCDSLHYLSSNRVKNGNFSNGNNSFTSQLTNNCNCLIGSYCVANDARGKCSIFQPVFDHTTGSGTGNDKFFIVDGRVQSPTKIWDVNIGSIQTGKTYTFSFWIHPNVSGQSPSTQPNITIKLGSTIILSITGTSIPGGQWKEYCTTFTATASISGPNMHLSINQTNASTNSGFDYGIDDIVFKTCKENIRPNPNVNNPSCYGLSNASITLAPTGGSPPYSYSWSTSDTTPGISGLMAGSYSVMITDADGDSTSQDFIVTQPEPVSVNVVQNSTCPGQANGYIALSTSGGTAPYTFSWSNGSQSAFLYNLDTGAYTVSINDANGCTSLTTATIDDRNLRCVPNCCGPDSSLIKCYSFFFDDSLNLKSDFPYDDACNTGTFSILKNAQDKCIAFDDVIDPVIPDGKFMVVEGSPTTANKRIWFDDYAFIPGKSYVIDGSFYLKLDSTLESMQLGYYVNEDYISIIDTTIDYQRQWNIYSTLCFNAKPGDSQLSIRQINLGGACGIDTIHIYTCAPNPVNPAVPANISINVCPGNFPFIFTLVVDSPVNAVHWWDGIVGPTREISGPGILPFIIIDPLGGYTVDTVVVSVVPTITISSFTPQGCSSDSILITGSGFIGTTDVLFNGLRATSFVIVSDTQINAVPPPAVSTGLITVLHNNCNGVSSIPFTVACAVPLNLNIFIEGYYIGNGIMNTPLYNFFVNADPTVCDSITVELHDAVTFEIAASVQTLLHADGSATMNFTETLNGGSYFIGVIHRSTIQTWSAMPVTFGDINYYNFTTASSQAYENNMIELDTGVWGFYSGDINQDGNIDLSDFPYWDADNAYFSFGYFNTDLNGDVNIDLSDFPFWDANNSNFIYSHHP